MKQTIQYIKNATIFIAQKQTKMIHGKQTVIEKATGTGCLISIEGLLHFITARHVLYDTKTGMWRKNMRLLYNTSNRKKKYNSIDLEKQINEGIFTPLIRNKHKDIIICPIQHIGEDIQTNIIDIGQNHIKESQMFETNDLIYCSYHPGVTEISKDLRIDPVIRKGMLSRINDGTIYMDGFTFPGNSGSAVYMKPTETKTGGEFVGIISGYIPYRDIATSNQTGNTRVIFEENTGLTIVYTMKYINAMLQSKTMKQSLQKIKKHLAKHA